MRIILASQSEFRKHALDILRLKYETIASNIEESKIRCEDLYKLAQLLSEAKAKKIGEDNLGCLVIAADLFVICDGKIIEKPDNENHAKKMLRNFSGKTFEIVTGLSAYNSDTKKMLSTTEVCKVRFRNLSDYEINDYVSRFPAVKCAGGFESDGLLRFAKHIEGNYNFRTAIPMNKLILFLRENEVEV